MRIVRFEYEGRAHWGRLDGDRIHALGGPAALSVELEAARLLTPRAEHGKILCVGVNYDEHASEMRRESPKYPSLFIRFPDSLVAHGEPIHRPAVSTQYDWEGELAVVIGRTAWRVSAERALEHVAGYTCFGDHSVRDFQRHTPHIAAGKNFHRSGAMGPWICTADEIPDPQALVLTTRINGRVMQHAQTAQMLFSVAEIIAYCSTITPLHEGDAIATGTPSGVGVARDPPVFLRAGDVVEVEIDRIGVLRNAVVEEPQRTV